MSPERASLTGVTLSQQYFLRELKGKGGMADVYQAWDRIRSVKMAIKVLRPEIQPDSLEYQLFEKEAAILRRIEHPFIVRLYELARDGQIIFLVMDWIEGGDLRGAIAGRRRPYRVDETLRVMTPVCRALNFMHQNGVFHCDIKPANILLHVDGRVLLTDFGVARLASEKHGGGTPAYMAPEQFLGRKIDARADVYSLGVTLYEMLSGGVMPFRGDHPSSQASTKQERIEWEHCNLDPPGLAQFNPQLAPDVVEVIHRALSKDPGNRYASTLAFLEALENAARLQPGQAPGANMPPAAPPAAPPYSAPHSQGGRAVVPGAAPVKGPHLIGLGGQYAGQALPIPLDKLTVGRGPDSQVWFRDRTVSRLHATLTRTRRAVYIQDEGSTLGTFVNQQRVFGPQALKHGDIIVIGRDQVFEFRER